MIYGLQFQTFRLVQTRLVEKPQLRPNYFAHPHIFPLMHMIIFQDLN